MMLQTLMLLYVLLSAETMLLPCVFIPIFVAAIHTYQNSCVPFSVDNVDVQQTVLLFFVPVLVPARTNDT